MTEDIAEKNQLATPISERDHAQGSKDAPLEIVQYGDYECPYCARVHPLLSELRKELKEKLHFVYRHFPLFRQHPHAQNAAEAAEAAAAQGRFWAMHEELSKRRNALDRLHLLQYAEALNLDTDRFEHGIEMGEHEAHILSDYEDGRASGVQTTPTFFVNGKRYEGDPQAATAELGDEALSVITRAYLKRLSEALHK